MVKALVLLCKALAQAIDATYNSYDRSTGDLMQALADFVRDHEK